MIKSHKMKKRLKIKTRGKLFKLLKKNPRCLKSQKLTSNGN